MAQMTLITGAERRRRWSFEERRQILAAANAPGAVVTEVARRADVCTSLIYKWRREDERAAERDSGFAPVMLVDQPAPSSSASDTAITVELGGARVKIGGDASVILVTAILKALRP
jgi:transposase